jgi:hypothetical protein
VRTTFRRSVESGISQAPTNKDNRLGAKTVLSLDQAAISGFTIDPILWPRLQRSEKSGTLCRWPAPIPAPEARIRSDPGGRQTWHRPRDCRLVLEVVGRSGDSMPDGDELRSLIGRVAPLTPDMVSTVVEVLGATGEAAARLSRVAKPSERITIRGQTSGLLPVGWSRRRTLA